MMTSPTVSVLIPAYNRAGFLPGTLGSVFAQTVPVTEVLLIDDGSNDDTSTVVAGLLDQHPDWRGRLHYISQANQGKSVALNRGLRLARGEWIAFNDSDDQWRPDKLEWQFRALAHMPDCGACVTESSRMEFEESRRRHPLRFQESGSGLGRIDDTSALFVSEWPGAYMQSVLVRRDVMAACGDFDPRLRIEQDVDFLFRLGLVTKVCFVALPLVDISRDIGRSVGLMTSFPDRSLARIEAREVRLATWLSLAARSRSELAPLIRLELASYRSELANRYMAAGDTAAARQVLARAMLGCFELRFLIKWAMAWVAPAVLRGLVRRRMPRRAVEASTGTL